MKVQLKRDGDVITFNTIKVASVYLADEYMLPISWVLSSLYRRCKYFKDYHIIYG